MLHGRGAWERAWQSFGGIEKTPCGNKTLTRAPQSSPYHIPLDFPSRLTPWLPLPPRLGCPSPTLLRLAKFSASRHLPPPKPKPLAYPTDFSFPQMKSFILRQAIAGRTSFFLPWALKSPQSARVSPENAERLDIYSRWWKHQGLKYELCPQTHYKRVSLGDVLPKETSGAEKLNNHVWIVPQEFEIPDYTDEICRHVVDVQFSPKPEPPEILGSEKRMQELVEEIQGEGGEQHLTGKTWWTIDSQVDTPEGHKRWLKGVTQGDELWFRYAPEAKEWVRQCRLTLVDFHSTAVLLTIGKKARWDTLL